MNFYPEYTGIIVLDLAGSKKFPPSAAATYTAAKSYEQKHSLTLLKQTPFVDSDTFTMLTKTANKLGVKKISDLKKVKSFSYAAFPECKTRITCLLGLKNVYGLKQVKFKALGSISVYTLIDKGQVTGGDGFTTDPQQRSTKYTELVDDKHIFGFQNVAPVVSKKLLNGKTGKEIAQISNQVSALLTMSAMRAMDKAAYVQKAKPKQSREVPQGQRLSSSEGRRSRRRVDRRALRRRAPPARLRRGDHARREPPRRRRVLVLRLHADEDAAAADRARRARSTGAPRLAPATIDVDGVWAWRDWMTSDWDDSGQLD